jgi:hypothetical protein
MNDNRMNEIENKKLKFKEKLDRLSTRFEIEPLVARASHKAPPEPLRPAREDKVLSVVYFIQCCETELIKIGISTQLLKRLRTLQASSAPRLRVLGIHRGGIIEETRLHYQFSHLHDHGEWFKPGDDLLSYIQTHCHIPRNSD